MAVAGCSHVLPIGDGGTDTDTDTDSETQDTETETEPEYSFWDWTCSIVLGTTCEDFDEDPETYWLNSDDYQSEDLTLVHGARSSLVVLATRTEGSGETPVVLVAQSLWEGPALEVGLLSATSGAAEAVDIFSPEAQEFHDGHFSMPNSVLGYPATAVICDEIGCALWGLEIDVSGAPTGLAPMDGGEIPVDGAAALTGTGSDPEVTWGVAKLCVAGDGVACFDGTEWSVEVEAGVASFNAIAGDVIGSYGHYLIAAGEEGVAWTNRDGEWTEVATNTSIDLKTVSANGGIFAAGGQGGFVFGDRDHAIFCGDEGDDPVTAVFARDMSVNDEERGLMVTALYADGHRFEIWQDDASATFGACVGDSGLSGEPRNAGNFPFGADAAFGYAITSTGVYVRVEMGIGPTQ